MLLQSLVALSTGEGDCAAIASLTTQLAEITASCDTLMMDILRAADQYAQIQRIQEVHVSSALAMALRKLNASYAKRTGELREAREQVDHLKAELEEAWKVAEDMAQEMDDLDNFHSGFSSESEPEEDDTRMDESVRLAEVIGVTGKAVAMKATLTQLVADRAKERERNDYENHSQRVSAAKKRSSRASKASLRLPKSSIGSVPPTPTGDRSSVSSRPSRRGRSRSKSRKRRSTAEESAPGSFKPPVPSLQVDQMAYRKSPKDDSFLEIETRPVSPASPRLQDLPPLPNSAVSLTCKSASQSQTDDRLTSLTAARLLPAQPEASTSTAHERRATLDFDIPPITISAPDDDTAHSGRSLGRRVQSYQPPRARSQGPEDGLRRASSDYKRFDGWPWQGPSTKKSRRQSLPLDGFAAETDAGPAPPALVDAPPPRVFSPPPPSYSTRPPT